MKKLMMICAAGLAVMAAVSCCKNTNKVTAIVAGPEQDVVALQIAYEAPVCPESVAPEAFEVEGREVVCAMACPKEGVVTVLLKGNCPKHECEGEKPECGEKHECGEKPACDKPCEKKCEKECEKKCDEPKSCCKEGKPECKKECKEIAVPKIAIKQVADLKDVEGNVIPAWKKAVKASDVKPLPKPGCGQKPECGEKPECEKPACDKPCGE